MLACCRLLASELGLDAGAAALSASRSAPELADADEVASLIRVYGLAFLPRALLAERTRRPELLRSAWQDADLERLQALVRRRAPIQDEALKAIILSDFVGALGAFGELGGGPELALLEQIAANARVVPGDAADTTFAFGRELILGHREISGLLFTIAHELGHHVTGALMGTGERAPAAVDRETLTAVGGALPGLLRAALELAGEPIVRDDRRIWRSPSGLSAICSWQECPGGPYTHFSFADGGGPIDPAVASGLACHVLGLLGIEPALAAAAESNRGVFHAGAPGARPRPDEVAARLAAVTPAQLDAAAAAGAAWLAALRAAGRVGTTQDDVRFILGLDERPPKVYAADGRQTWDDLAACEQVAAGADLGGGTPEQLADLLRLVVRCGDPGALRRVLAAGPAIAAGGAGLEDLGRSRCAVREGAGVSVFGAGPGELLDVLALLHGAGFDLDGAVTEDGATLLTDAAARSPELVDALLAAGAALGAPDADGHTALHRAAQAGDGALCARLTGLGAEVDARAARGETPLLLAGSVAAASALRDAGAELDAETSSGETPLIRAAGAGAADLVRFLLSAGADPDAATDLGDTALHRATRVWWDAAAAVVGALLDAGADPQAENDAGATPIGLAGGRDELVALLAAAGGAEPDRRP